MPPKKLTTRRKEEQSRRDAPEKWAKKDLQRVQQTLETEESDIRKALETELEQGTEALHLRMRMENVMTAIRDINAFEAFQRTLTQTLEETQRRDIEQMRPAPNVQEDRFREPEEGDGWDVLDGATTLADDDWDVVDGGDAPPTTVATGFEEVTMGMLLASIPPLRQVVSTATTVTTPPPPPPTPTLPQLETPNQILTEDDGSPMSPGIPHTPPPPPPTNGVHIPTLTLPLANATTPGSDEHSPTEPTGQDGKPTFSGYHSE